MLMLVKPRVRAQKLAAKLRTYDVTIPVSEYLEHKLASEIKAAQWQVLDVLADTLYSISSNRGDVPLFRVMDEINQLRSDLNL